MLMARVPGSKTLARKPRSPRGNTFSDVTGLPVSRFLRTREPRSLILSSGVSRIALDGTLSNGSERKSSSRVNVPAFSGRAATKDRVGGADALSAATPDALGGVLLEAIHP